MENLIPTTAAPATQRIPNKYQLADKMRNHFHIPDQYLPLLSKYFLLHMSGTSFSRALNDGTIAGIPDIENMYDVIYHHCCPYAVKRAQEIRISYRAAIDSLGLPRIALVEIVIPADVSK